MQVTRPAGRSLTVGELYEALATCPDNAPVNILLGDEEGSTAPVVRVTAMRFGADIVVDAVDPSGLISFAEEVVNGEYTLRQAKAEAILVLRAAGIEVSA